MTSTLAPPPVRGRIRRALALAELAGALLLVGVLFLASGSGFGAIPALGSVLNPGTGVWAEAANGALPTDQTLRVPGLGDTATIGFESNGITHITAGSDTDMFEAMGYAHARFRIFSMDLARRQAAGRLSEVIGEQGLDSDTFELDLGLVRAAERDLRELSPESRATLDAYSQGVNAAIADMRAHNGLPMYFTLLGHQPQPWTPLDSLMVQRLETQMLSLSDRPLLFSFMEDGLRQQLFSRWLTAVPQNTQYPYDPGPYQKLPLTPLPIGSDPAAASPTSVATVPSAATPAPQPKQSGEAIAATSATLTRLAALPPNAVHSIGNSNAWVVSGSRTASGKPIMAADPHLTLTVPSLWFQLTARSPGYDLAGVTLPGVPAVLMGHNQHVSWGITNSQHSSTFYYQEKTDPNRPDQYFWNGQWRPMAKVDYQIKVKGGAPVDHTVRLTVHGPVITQYGLTTSVWFAGTLPSDNLSAALAVGRATNFDQFHEALRGWRTPSANFAFADQAGDIGIINAGYVPQVRSGAPYLPMSGTGETDVIGTVPFEALPIVHNPPSGIVSTSNQREVTADYPYYYGYGYDFFDPGWRESSIVHALDGRTNITASDMQRLQMSQTDTTAPALLPALLSALDGQSLNPTEKAARDQLAAWNFDIGADSAGATIWTRFITWYSYDVWHPMWQAYKIPDPPVNGFSPRLSRNSYAVDALLGLLVNATNTDPTNAIFTPPGSPGRTSVDVLRQAFRDVVKEQTGKRGPDATTWQYGNSHSVMIASLLQVTPLDVGPFRYGSNGRVIDSIVSPPQTRDGKVLDTVHIGGPSWRFVMDWGTGKAVSSLPGGTSENSTSPWYANGVPDWLAGRFSPMLSGDEAIAATKGRTWTLKP